MAALMTLVYVIIIILYDVVAKKDQLINANDITTDKEINDTIYNSTSEMNETERFVNEIYFYNLTEDVNVILRTTTDMKNEKKCNKTIQDSTLTNIETNSSVLSNFLDEFLIDKKKVSGVNLNDIVMSDCGGAKVCPHSNWTANDTITIGFLGAYARSKTVLGALPLAVAAINREPTLLPGLKLQFVAADIGRSRPSLLMNKDSLSLRVMTQMRDLGVVAFFGPDETCHTEAKLAAAWNLPLISHKCSGARGSSQEAGAGLGATFARTLPPAYKISKSVVALLKAFSWTKFAIIAGDELTAAAQQMNAIKELAQSEGMTVTVEHRFADYLPKHISDMERIVDQTYDKTRVYVFLGEHIALVDFVSVLQRRGLLEDGLYTVIAVDDDIYDPSTAAFTHADHLGQNSSTDILAFRAVLKLTSSFPVNPHYGALCQMIRELSAASPFRVPNYHKIFEDTSVPIEAAHLYDAVILWAQAATDAMVTGPPTNGAAVMKRLRPSTYRSVQGYDFILNNSRSKARAIVGALTGHYATGTIKLTLDPGCRACGEEEETMEHFVLCDCDVLVNIDEAGDAEGNFTVIGLVADCIVPGRWSAQPVATFRYPNSSTFLPELVGGGNIAWIGGKPPAAEPDCGFDGAKCAIPYDPGMISAISAAATAAILVVALLAKHYRYEQKLASVLWKIDAKDLTFIPAGSAGGSQRTSIPEDAEVRRAHTTIAVYKGNIVAVKKLQKKYVDVTRAIRKELKQIRELRHENLTPIIGVCVESGSACIVSTYCSRGSLARVLSNRDLHLDDMFVASLVADLLRGLTYIHDSALISHGNLTSSNCLVDSRWVLQISDYGLHRLKSSCPYMEDALQMERRMLWRAPELLRDPNPPPRGSQKGDIYSFGIVLYEILGRNGPWGETNLTYGEIIGRVRQPIEGMLYRPPTSGLACRPSVLAVLNACWSERSDCRPDLRLVRLRLKDMHAGMKTNIFDNMLAMMEKYASNLENVVADRTEQLLQEKRKTDELLHRMLPRTVAEALKRGERVQAESFDCVTILFSDIVGFTKLVASITPMQVVDILNDMYTCCDAIISYYKVYKVETVGDAYMVVCGVPVRCSKHAAEVASLALHMLENVPKIRLRNLPVAKLSIRIGIHSGQCAAGVVGDKMPRYCLFGDTVNTAARMQSSGEPQKIHISNDTYRLLKKHGGYRFKERGVVNIKGKGEMKTWWLVGEDHERRKNPLFRFQPDQNRSSEAEGNQEPWWGPDRPILDIRDRARLSCRGSMDPGSALSSPGPPACACFMPPRDHHSDPVVTFCDE